MYTSNIVKIEQDETHRIHVGHICIHERLNFMGSMYPKYPDPSKMPILRTRTPAIQVPTPPLEDPRILRVGKYTVRPMDPSWEIFFFSYIKTGPFSIGGKTPVHEAVCWLGGGFKTSTLSSYMINANFGSASQDLDTWLISVVNKYPK